MRACRVTPLRKVALSGQAQGNSVHEKRAACVQRDAGLPEDLTILIGSWPRLEVDVKARILSLAKETAPGRRPDLRLRPCFGPLLTRNSLLARVYS